MLSLVLIFTLVFGMGWETVFAQSPNLIYSEKTGHSISGAFLEYYLRAKNPQEVYGEPITDAFTDNKSNQLVQYFEKARFEYHFSAGEDQAIQPTPLGYLHYKISRAKATPEAQINNSPNCRVFPDTSYRVCRAFLTYYQENGAEHTFGPPVSDAISLDNYLVQYFFYAKLIWNPNLPSGKSIVVADLGYEYFFTNKEDPSRLEPQPNARNSAIAGIVELNARAVPMEAVTTRNGSQTISIHVTDQRRIAVAGVQAVLIVRMPSGEENRYIVNKLTDANGLTYFTFPYASRDIGLAEIQVDITRDGLQASTKTSFRIWW